MLTLSPADQHPEEKKHHESKGLFPNPHKLHITWLQWDDYTLLARILWRLLTGAHYIDLHLWLNTGASFSSSVHVWPASHYRSWRKRYGARGAEGWSAFMWCGLEIQILKTIAVFYVFTVKGHCLQQAEYLTCYWKHYYMHFVVLSGCLGEGGAITENIHTHTRTSVESDGVYCNYCTSVAPARTWWPIQKGPLHWAACTSKCV